MKKQNILLSLCMVVLFSCSPNKLIDDDNKLLDSNINNSQISEELLIDKSSIDLNVNDAKNVALMFRLKKNSRRINTRATDNNENLNIQVVTDSITKKPIFYIVNWNKGGYVLISANKKNTPIIAFSETGHFDSRIDIGSKYYIEQYKSEIVNSYKNDTDSLRKKHSLEWSIFEKTKLATFPKTRVLGPGGNTIKDINKAIQEEINKKTDLGYTYIGKISALSYYLPTDEYQQVIKDISTHTDTRYNYADVSLFFIKSYNFDQIGPLIKTEWGQGNPLNVEAPNGLAGCVPTAVAQITYYYKYPKKYDWNQIYLNPILNDSFKTFILDIRKLCNVKYKSGGTSSTIDDALSAFKSLGYDAKINGAPDFIKLREEITSNRPVYIRGENNKEQGHAWVCEGYLNRKYKAVITYIENAPYIDTPYSDYDLNINSPSSHDGMDGEFYYMNFGWNGVNNGWYRANSYNPSDEDDCFPNKQNTIMVKKGY